MKYLKIWTALLLLVALIGGVCAALAQSLPTGSSGSPLTSGDATITIAPGAITASKMASGAAAANLNLGTGVGAALQVQAGAANGFPRLDGSGLLPASVIPPVYLGSLPVCTPGSTVAPVPTGQAFQCGGVILIAQ